MFFHRACLLSLIACGFACIHTAEAVNFQVTGDVRLLSEFQGNKELNVNGRLVNVGQIFLRPILRPKLFISDRFVLVSEWSLLEPTGFNEFPLSGGATRPTTLLNTLPIRGYPFGLLQTTNAGLIPNPIRINEMYLRWDTDLLTVEAGRMERDWGLGMIFDNGQDRPFSNFKSIMDAITLSVPLGSELVVAGGYYKDVDSLFNTEADDSAHLYISAIHRQAKSKLETGIFAELAFMGDQSARSLPGGAGVARNEGGSYFMLDGYGIIYPSVNLKLSAEVSYVDGKDPTTPFAKTTWDTLTTFAGIVDAEFSYPMIRFGASGGYFQGDGNGTGDSKNSSFIFAHPNQSIGIILTRSAYGFSTASATSFYPYEFKPGHYINGTGLVYAKPYISFILGNDWTIDVDIPLAWSHVKGPAFATRKGSFMGAETDVKIKHVWEDTFETTLYGALLIPGSFFQDLTAPNTPSVAYAFGFLGSLAF